MKAHGPVLLVVDQPATIGALPVAVALDEGVTVAYLPGLAMRRIADLHPGSAKTDARDAAVIADAARTMPHTLRALKLDDETIAELTVLSGFDDDLAGQITATSNRIRGLLTQIHPALERVLGPRHGPPGRAGPDRNLAHPSRSHRRREDQGADPAAQKGTTARRPAHRGDLRRARRADRRRHRHQRRRRRAATAGHATRGAAPAARRGRRTGRGTRGGAPSFQGPDHHARCRGQDLRTHPHRGRRQGLPHRRAPGLLRRAGAGHPPIRDLPSAGNTHPAAATKSSNEPCSCPRSRP